MTPGDIQAARRALGWTQGDLAKAAGVPLTAVIRIERGFPQPATFSAQIEAALCDALGDPKGAAAARRRVLPALTGAQIVAARQSLGWSRRNLAHRAGTSRDTVKRSETDLPLSAASRVAIIAALLSAMRAGPTRTSAEPR